MSGGDLPAELADALQALAGVRRLLVALDFDGTLAPRVDAPERARALPRATDAVLTLAELPHTRVAVVSGRALASLAAVTRLPDHVLLVGSHGVELRTDDDPGPVELSPGERRDLDALREVLDGIAGATEGVWVEAKPAGFALHTRLAAQPDGRAARDSALAAAHAAVPGATVRHGKDVLEFALREATKGDALERLRAITAADALLYAGDDATDEDAFAVLRRGDLGLKSGPGDTMAAFRVPGPPEVAHALTRLAAARAAAPGAPRVLPGQQPPQH